MFQDSSKNSNWKPTKSTRSGMSLSILPSPELIKPFILSHPPIQLQTFVNPVVNQSTENNGWVNGSGSILTQPHTIQPNQWYPANSIRSGRERNHMSTKKEVVKVCDVCQKRVSDEGETYFGGHPHAGWFYIEMHGGPTDLRSLQSQHQWDVCGRKCLTELAKKLSR